MDPRIRNVPPKTTDELASEWDRAVSTRDRQISSGVDVSLTKVIRPALMGLVPAHSQSLLEVGCGSGWLAGILSERADRVIGIDPSERSIELARRSLNLQGVSFEVASVEAYGETNADAFDGVVANMSLMAMADLRGGVRAISRVLARSGWFVFSITHPWFWPTYWGYQDAPWFEYRNELFIEAPFRITHEEATVTTTHVHRPLSRYVEELHNAGLSVSRIVEPTPTGEVQNEFPEDWAFPRFLLGACTLS